MLDKLYEKSLQVESLSQNTFGKLYTITEMEFVSKNSSEVWSLQLLKKVATEKLRREAQGFDSESSDMALPS
ncbi:MAG: hypothetical protein QNL04_12035 [SAR324 cluster bacterium]|nr:hypothetical protein [SAR324 cluster bacterium]